MLSGAIANTATAQQKVTDERQQLVGTWRVKSFETRILATNAITRPIGDNPIGYIQFSAGGHVVSFASSGNILKPAKIPFTDAERAAFTKQYLPGIRERIASKAILLRITT